ncbi:armadillo-type protein, partial [Baffinella frigidus]
MGDVAQFEVMIRTLMSQSNEERNRAEAAFEELCKQPEAAAPLLCAGMTQSADETVRSLTAVMFRKRVTVEFYNQLTPPTQIALKGALIAAVENEQMHMVRKKIADTTGEIAAMIIEDPEGSWPEMLPFLFQSGRSANAPLRESAMLIIARLTFAASEVLVQNLQVVLELCSATLQDANKDVRLAALSATCNFVVAISEQRATLESTSGLVPVMFGVLSTALNENDEESSRQSLEEFIAVAEEAPKLFRKFLDPLVTMSLQIVTAENLEDQTRFLAVELLLTISEQAPGMMRKHTIFLSNMVPMALKLMLKVEHMDLAEWNQTTDDDDDDESSSLDVGKDALDRLALSIGGKAVFQLAFQQELVPTFLAHPEWVYRHAALSCISQIAEGCSKQMKAHLKDIVEQIACRFVDEHPRVRWAAINAMGQLETDLGPDLQDGYHARVLPALVHVMEDAANPRVQSHAAAAVINFTENCKKEILIGYLDGLLGKLVILLQGGVRIVQEQAITAIASVADCVEDAFAPYYAGIVPTLKQMLTQCTSKEHRLLRGKTMECISLIGIAVGKEVFRNDAKEVMDQFFATQSTAMDPDDPQASYLLQAWGRVAKALGQEFIPYLHVVMPPLLQSAGIKAETEIADEDGEEGEDEEGIAHVVIETDTGTKKVALKTSALEEKETACNMLVCYFAELQEGMFPYIEGVAGLMIPLLAFVYSSEVRTAAAALMPELVRAAVVSLSKNLCQPTFVATLCAMIFDKVVKAIVEEPEPEVQLALIEALQESLDHGGAGCLGNVDGLYTKEKEVLESLAAVTGEVLQRAQGRAEARTDEDFDEEEEEEQEEESMRDDTLLDQIATCIGKLAKTHPAGV